MDSAKRGIVEELHKQARKRFPRRRVYVKSIDDLWQIDLVDMQKYAKFNKGQKYILTVIDVLSKFAWAVPVRDKSGKAVTAAMKRVLTSRIPKNIQCDRGNEFYNKDFTALMNSYDINLYSTFSPLKASVVERFNRTIKVWMHKEFSVQGDYKWLDLLPTLLLKYNNRVHRTIGMKPIKVRAHHSKMLAEKLNTPPPNASRKVSFKKGDIVRISKYKTLFEKGYTPSWTTELFTVNKVKRTVPSMYLLHDSADQPISGLFYAQELQKTDYPNTYLVERVLRRKGKRVYVKWLGFDNRHNSWI